MNLLTPDIGLLFWSLITFLFLLAILKKYAWKPILNGIQERNDSIDEALKSAEKARAEVSEMKNQNEQIIQEAKLERDVIIKQARETSLKLIEESEKKATERVAKMMAEAKKQIATEQQQAINELKTQIGLHSVSIAEKILKKELAKEANQEAFIGELLKDIEIN